MIEEVEKATHKKTGGRPKKAIKRQSATGVRFTKSEYFIVRQKASKAGLKLSNYIRKMAIDGEVFAAMNPEEKQLLKQLVGMANNINQITKKAHTESLLSALLVFEKIRGQLDTLLNQLKR